eukprot:14325206-Alexandrium_andersonii.AAC.1
MRTGLWHQLAVACAGASAVGASTGKRDHALHACANFSQNPTSTKRGVNCAEQCREGLQAI